MYDFEDISFDVLGQGLAAEIGRWCDKYCNVSQFKVHVTPDSEVIITSNGFLDWDESLHNQFCEEFNLILFKVTCAHIYYNQDYTSIVVFHYGFAFDNPGRFDEYCLKWDDFACDEQGSLEYVNNDLNEVYNTIESLMGEYIEASREFGCTDNQKEYYKIKLDALYELNRRIK